MNKIKHLSLITATFLSIFIYSPTNITGSEEFPINLSDFERKVYSQNGEDGLLEKAFEVLGILTEGTFVEFGIETKNEYNARYFKEKFGWNGILIDPDH